MRRAASILVVLLLAALAFIARCWNVREVFVGEHIYFVDADCYSRMTRAREVAEGRGLFIKKHDFENWPQGTHPHTTAPMDWVIVAGKGILDVGFDWPEAAPVFDKVREELVEIEAEVATGKAEEIEEEIGDLLFSVVNLARKLHVNGETALQRATDKFTGRFKQVEALARERGLVLEGMTLAELDALWDEVKG